MAIKYLISSIKALKYLLPVVESTVPTTRILHQITLNEGRYRGEGKPEYVTYQTGLLPLLCPNPGCTPQDVSLNLLLFLLKRPFHPMGAQFHPVISININNYTIITFTGKWP